MAVRVIKVGVRDLLNLFFYPKDLGSSFQPATRGQEGTEGHQLITANRPGGYRRETPIEFRYRREDLLLIVRGRLDGFHDHGDTLEVEEIKTTYAPLDRLSAGLAPYHEAQLKLYLFFLMANNPGKQVVGKLTYLNLEDLSERSFPYRISLAEGRAFFNLLANAFLDNVRAREEWIAVRNESLAALAFPFREPRPGQEELMETVTQALTQERDLFVEAATGIGKTIAVLYPALKQLAESDRVQQIFFLTAKTAGKAILRKTLVAARKAGLRLRTVFIEAKGRVCFSPGCECRPEECPYAADYYAKAQQVIPALLRQELLTPEIVRECAKRAGLCPFELSLDLALHADLIICDYNYVFDPRVYLRRFFLRPGQGPYLFLVDEAHNLVTRGREMYSAALDAGELTALRDELNAVDPGLAAACDAVAAFFRGWQREMAEENRPGIRLSHLPEMLEPALEHLVAEAERFVRHQVGNPLWARVREFYYAVIAFTRIAALVNEAYALYVKGEGQHSILRLFCLNPGPHLRRCLDRGRSAVFFSATLSPMEYFRELLGGMPDSQHLRLASPFLQENRLYLHVPGVDTRYRAREQSAAAVAQCVREMTAAHDGNYLVFFPSYAYLKAVQPLIKEALGEKASLFVQFPSMTDAQKGEFLRRVSAPGKGKSHVGLAVLGGLFGEAVDLPGDQLVGVLIVGPGLPVLSDEQELIRLYFDERNGEGFLYAYLIPGLIRVIQSAGRVFRTPADRGVVLLVDDRFLVEKYRELLPPDWFSPRREFSAENYVEVLRAFWQETAV